jgi:aspartyl protease family protein
MTRENRPQESNKGGLSTGMTALAWIAIMVFVALYFDDLLDRQNNPNRSPSTEYVEDNIRLVTLQRNRYGHYVTAGKVNGQDVVFMLDTGATGVAIPDHVAKRLNINRGSAFRVNTANGTTVAYQTQLNTVSVGDIKLTNVQGAITPAYKSDEILLGMSFLKYVEFTQRGDTLILKQYL